MKPVLARRPYTPRRLETLATFAEYHPISRFNAPPIRRILGTWATPDGVLEWTVDGRTALVGAVVAGMENVHDAALLEILGWDEDTPFGPLLDAVTPVALALAKSRPKLSLSLPSGFAGEVGPAWTAAEGSFVMARGNEPWPDPPLPAGATWEDLSRATVAEHYAVMKRAFVDDPGTMIPPFPTFGDVALVSDPPVRILRREGVEIGFARVSLEGDGLGYVATIGRDPSARGQGLGPIVLAEALRVLAARGMTRFRLGVTASNSSAVELYRRSGFTVVESWITWLRPVEGT